MERIISQDFKETEIGPIPKDWEVVRLRDITEIKYGKSNPNISGKIPVVGSGGIYDYTSTPLVNFPTIVIGRKGTAGKTWLMEIPSYPSDTTFYLIMKRELLLKFIYYYMLKYPLSGEHAKTTLPSLQKPYLENYNLPFPPIPEQKAIADVLSTVQEDIEKTEAVINSTKELKKSLMNHLFTYGPVPINEAEDVNLKETEIGPMPEGWKVTRLGDIFEIQQGITLCREPLPGRFLKPFLRTSNVFWGKIDLSNLDSMYFSEKQIQSLTLKSKDLLICEGGDIGRTAIWNEQIDECCHQNHLHRLRVKNGLKIKSEFYMYWMQFGMLIRGLYSEEGNKTTIPNLSRSRLSNFIIPLPSLPIQKQIADILSAVDAKIEVEENKAKALEKLFQSLLNDLMTGKIRVREEVA